MFRPAVLALACLAAGCHINLRGSNLVVDGVELEEKHIETIEIGTWDPMGLAIETGMGDVTVRPGDGGNRITVTLHEVTMGDARAAYENGKLVTRTASGEPSAIGDVTIYTDDALPTLIVNTGMGDVEVGDVSLLGTVELNTGMGDIELVRFGTPDRVVVSTGMGDLEVHDGATVTLDASSGMGDVEVTGVTATDASCSSGMGDVDVRRCSFDEIEANTGLGNIDCSSTSYHRAEFDTGLGKVRND